LKEKKVEIILQYRQREVDMDDVVKRVEEDYKAHGNTDPIVKKEIYVKPEDFTAYYVINDLVEGKVLLF